VSNKYFIRDFSHRWKLSKRHECFVCEKYRYTIIFYERGVVSQNQGLTEIKDTKFLEELQSEFDKNYLNYKGLAPCISGSVVKKD